MSLDQPSYNFCHYQKAPNKYFPKRFACLGIIPTETFLYILSSYSYYNGIIVFTLTDMQEDIGNTAKRNEFEQTVGRKHYLPRQDINNIKRNVQDNPVIRRQEMEHMLA